MHYTFINLEMKVVVGLVVLANQIAAVFAAQSVIHEAKRSYNLSSSARGGPHI